ncbi:3-oxoacyl-ACP reductase [Streptomyces sp. IBSNAI002]|uniref:3-oxoacyl-ACP reductase n=1 Tax=Streptomyces sp. IBSNAI002 TaxID=3457500 RepID=UPI003FD029C5
MSDFLQHLMSSRAGRALLRRAGVPVPAPLVRHTPGGPAIPGPVLVGGTPKGRLGTAVKGVLADAGAEALTSLPEGGRPAALAFDATGLTGAGALAELYAFTHPVMRGLSPGGRVVVLGDVPGPKPADALAAQALEGFTRSLGKELRGGATCQLLQVGPGAEHLIGSPLRFLLSPRSAYVSGQVVRVEATTASSAPVRWEAPLSGSVAAVTGAARGIGAVVAEVLARDGATVVCLDLPSQEAGLARTAQRIGGTALPVDITAGDAPGRIRAHLRAEFGGVDVFVHNAGITRDRTLARMSPQEWDTVLDVNLGAVHRITATLLAEGQDGPVLRDGGALVCTSSIGGIAGNRGQTNYGASKAGLIGLVRAYAPLLAERSIRINAVAPGFIETDMTARMPLLVREAGRRMNSLGQGGLPVDVAETVAWLAAPATAGVSGQTIRVCGQSLLGA